jgi:hypothetical protein
VTPVQPQARDNRLANPLAIDAWVEQGKLTTSDGAERDVLGSAAAISADVIVLGAAGDDAERGSAYVFVKPAAGWANLTETAKLTASDGATLDWFGYSAAMDGDTIVIGAPGGPTGPSTVPGAVYIFVKPSGGWADMTQTARLTASDGAAGDGFGWSVAMDGDTLVAGAYTDSIDASQQGSAYVFSNDTRLRIYFPLIWR